MTTTAHQSTIDIAAAVREVERAATMFVCGDVEPALSGSP
jgi:hypothetical protein